MRGQRRRRRRRRRIRGLVCLYLRGWWRREYHYLENGRRMVGLFRPLRSPNPRFDSRSPSIAVKRDHLAPPIVKLSLANQAVTRPARYTNVHFSFPCINYNYTLYLRGLSSRPLFSVYLSLSPRRTRAIYLPFSCCFSRSLSRFGKRYLLRKRFCNSVCQISINK